MLTADAGLVVDDDGVVVVAVEPPVGNGNGVDAEQRDAMTSGALRVVVSTHAPLNAVQAPVVLARNVHPTAFMAEHRFWHSPAVLTTVGPNVCFAQSVMSFPTTRGWHDERGALQYDASHTEGLVEHPVASRVRVRQLGEPPRGIQRQTPAFTS